MSEIAPLLSVIIPCLDEGGIIRQRLRALQDLRRAGCELILVDGGSQDTSCQEASGLVDQLLLAKKGRAVQMNAGAHAASGQMLWFLHIDTGVSADALAQLIAISQQKHPVWGRFDIRLSGDKNAFRLIETMMNWRSRMTAIATGDQGIFVSRDLFESIGGFPEIDLMEDIALSSRLKKKIKPLCFKARLVTSSRRWEQGGVWKTVWLMWRLRFAYALGRDPVELAREYKTCSTPMPES